MVRRRRDVREITGKRENKMELGEITGKREKIEVGESRTKSAVRRPRRKRDNWKEIK